MHKTLLGGVSDVRKPYATVRKSIAQWKKSHRKLAAILTLCLKLSIIALPIGVLPAQAKTPVQAPIVVQEITLDHGQALFIQDSKPVEFKPGDSNTTMAAHRKSAVAQITSAPLAPAPGIDEMRAVYKAAGDKYGVPAQLIEAVHQVETGKSWDTARGSSAGAVGPMQFTRGTFRNYCARTGEGCSITSAHDSIFAASLLLSANYNGSWDHALMAYNHSLAYVHKVKSIANQIGADI